MKQQELKSTNIDFSLITTFCYTHQNLSPFDSTGSYKIFLSNTIHQSIFLYRIDIPSIVQYKKLLGLELFFQQCKYPRCRLIKFFCDPFQSHKQTWKWLIFKQMSANRYFFFLTWNDDEKCSLPNLPFQTKDSSQKKTCVALYLGSKRTHSAEWLDAFISLSTFFSCHLLSEMPVQMLNVLLKQYITFCYKMVSLLLLLSFCWISIPKAGFLRTNVTGHPSLILLASSLKEQGKAGKSPCNYCKWIFQKT